MAKIAELLDPRVVSILQPKHNPTRLHAVAAFSGLSGCPLKVDANRRLRSANGRFVSVR